MEIATINIIPENAFLLDLDDDSLFVQALTETIKNQIKPEA